MASNSAACPPFATILVSRSSEEPPSKLELMLRQSSQRLRVVKKLSAGAHLLIPGSETTIAVRVYGPETIQRLELSESQTLQARQKRLQQVLFRLHNVTLDEKVSAFNNGISYREESNKENTDLNSNPFRNHDKANREARDDYDVDGLKAFRDAFKYPVVFFILPRREEENGRNQLLKPDSFLNRAQRALLDYSVSPGDTGEQKMKDAQDQGQSPLPKGAARILVVQDEQSLLSMLQSIVESSKPEKREKKQKYYEIEAARNFLIDPKSSQPTTRQTIPPHIVDAFGAWADRCELPQGESDILLRYFGSLQGVISADAAALKDVPILDSSKETILQFFGGSTDTFPPNENERGDMGQIQDKRMLSATHIHPSIVMNHQTPQHQQQLQHPHGGSNQGSSWMPSSHMPSMERNGYRTQVAQPPSLSFRHESVISPQRTPFAMGGLARFTARGAGSRSSSDQPPTAYSINNQGIFHEHERNQGMNSDTTEYRRINPTSQNRSFPQRRVNPDQSRPFSSHHSNVQQGHSLYEQNYPNQGNPQPNMQRYAHQESRRPFSQMSTRPFSQMGNGISNRSDHLPKQRETFPPRAQQSPSAINPNYFQHWAFNG